MIVPIEIQNKGKLNGSLHDNYTPRKSFTRIATNVHEFFINYFPTQSYKGTEIIKALLLIAFLKQESSAV